MANANIPSNCNMYTSTIQVVASSSSERRVSHDPSDAKKLFVGNLSWNTTCDKLNQYFSMFGHVADVNIIRDPITKSSKGYGFVTFTEIATLENVLSVPIHVLDGRKIDPKRAIPKHRAKKAKLFVGGLSQTTSANDIVEYFARYGRVQDIMMPADQRSGGHRGFGFVTFENDRVIESVCAFEGHTINRKRVECKRTTPRRSALANASVPQRWRMSNSQTTETPPVINPAFINESPRSRPSSRARTGTGHSRHSGRRRHRNHRYTPYNHPAAAPAVTTVTTTTSRTTVTPSTAAVPSQIVSSNAANFYLEYDSNNVQ